jgi:uncharacterized protein YcbX
MLGTVTRLRRYPVKSMLGEDVPHSAVGAAGLTHDPMGDSGPEPCVGVYATVVHPGHISKGDPVSFI